MQNNHIVLDLKKQYPFLSKSEQTIIDFVLENPERVSFLTINDMAKELNVSIATISRFSKKIGFSSFQEFKLALVASVTKSHFSNTFHEHVSSTDSHDDVVRKVFESNIKSLNDTQTLFDLNAYQQAVDYIGNTNRLAFFGLGGSVVVAFDAYHKFIRTHLTCIFTIDKHLQLIEASHLNEHDCAIVICHSGMNKDTLEIVDVLKENHVKIILITSFPMSKIAEQADVMLVSVSEETKYRSEALSSRISQLALIDLLYIGVAIQHEEEVEASLKQLRRAIKPTKIN